MPLRQQGSVLSRNKAAIGAAIAIGVCVFLFVALGGVKPRQLVPTGSKHTRHHHEAPGDVEEAGGVPHAPAGDDGSVTDVAMREAMLNNGGKRPGRPGGDGDDDSVADAVWTQKRGGGAARDDTVGPDDGMGPDDAMDESERELMRQVREVTRGRGHSDIDVDEEGADDDENAPGPGPDDEGSEDGDSDDGGLEYDGDCDYQAEVMHDSPVGLWRMVANKKSTLVRDDTRRGLNAKAQGVRFGAPTAVRCTGPAEHSARFEHAKQAMIAVPSDRLGGDKWHRWSVEAWVRLRGLTGDSRQAAVSASDGKRGLALVLRQKHGKGSWRIGCGDGSHWHEVNGPAAEMKQWTYLAATYDGRQLTLYVNGHKAATSALKCKWPAGLPFTIGGKPFFEGDMDEVAVYRTALDKKKIRLHWEASGWPLALAKKNKNKGTKHRGEKGSAEVGDQGEEQDWGDEPASKPAASADSAASGDSADAFSTTSESGQARDEPSASASSPTSSKEDDSDALSSSDSSSGDSETDGSAQHGSSNSDESDSSSSSDESDRSSSRTSSSGDSSSGGDESDNGSSSDESDNSSSSDESDNSSSSDESDNSSSGESDADTNSPSSSSSSRGSSNNAIHSDGSEDEGASSSL